jgi:subtilisin family serine protease
MTINAEPRLNYRIVIISVLCILICSIHLVSALDDNKGITNLITNSSVNTANAGTPVNVQLPEKELPSHQQLNTDPTGKYVEGQVIVRYKPEVVNNEVSYQAATKSANEKINPQKIEEIGSKSVPGVQFILLPSGISVEEATEIYSKDPNVLWVQPNYVYHLTNVPNDPLFDQQWSLHNTGQSVNGQPAGTPGDDIHAPEAWDTFTGPVGSNDVVVAVVDTGIDYTHPDLQDNIWTNAGEMGTDSQGRDKRSNGIDDDGNGIVDDWHGWNLVDRNGNITDDIGHGTEMAGIIGATGNNGIGISGINWRVKIVPVKIFNNYGSASDFWIMQGMTRAVEEAHATIISNSWSGGDSPDHYVKDFITQNRNVLFMFAAGNCNPDLASPCNCSYSVNRNMDDTNTHCKAFPASYDVNNIISVASSDQNDNLAYHSNYGAISVDLTAPGTNITTTIPIRNGIYYHVSDGTSPATAAVSGVAALIKSINPSASPTTIKNAILQNVDQRSSLSGLVLSGGRLNANRALSSISVTVPPIPDFNADVTSGRVPLTVHFTDKSAGARINSWSWDFGDGGRSYLPSPTYSYSTVGTYTVSLSLNNGYPNTTTKTSYITVST